MKNILLLGAALCLASTVSFGQTHATDFTAADCDGNSHNLFSELDDGKVIVLAWVMPCATCIVDPAYAYSIVQGYESSDPGKVLFYMVDDYGNTTCESLNSWAANYNMEGATTFSDNHITMSDYGTDGMPKIVVLGGSDHKIFFNENSSSTGIEDAISAAFAASNSVAIDELSDSKLSVSSFPNPATDVLTVSYELGQRSSVAMEVVDLLGNQVVVLRNEGAKGAGAHQTQVDVQDLNNGAYFLKLSTTDGVKTVSFIVAH